MSKIPQSLSLTQRRNLQADNENLAVQQIADSGTEHSAPQHLHACEDLGLLVWKYFEEDIRAALVDVQKALANHELKPQKIRIRKKEGK
ncbi:MAG TPA: hypothetical protein VJL58_05000 [Pyrinomonadaceae bacterium]|nr:hypothetical protein [Pyrinomonadaceae bacterium]